MVFLFPFIFIKTENTPEGRSKYDGIRNERISFDHEIIVALTTHYDFLQGLFASLPSVIWT